MYIKKTKHVFADGSVKTQITLVESYRPGKGMKSKKRTIKDYGYLENHEDPESFLSGLQQLVEESRSGRKSVNPSFDMNKSIDDLSNLDVNYGPFIIRQIYKQLNIPEFLKIYKRTKTKYDLNEILCHLTTISIIYPESKSVTHLGYDYIHGTDTAFSPDDIRLALDEISDLSVGLQQHLKNEVMKLFDADQSCVYLDYTNTYFRKSLPKDPQEQGMAAKQLRKQSVVRQMYLLDNHGLPFYHDCYFDTASDRSPIQILIENAEKNKMIRGKVTFIADRRFNSARNIDYLCNRGDGYIFSQPVRGKKGARYLKRLFDESLYTTSKDGTYKWQMFDETVSGRNTDGKKTDRRRRVLLYWSAADVENSRNMRKKKIALAAEKQAKASAVMDISGEEIQNSISDFGNNDLKAAAALNESIYREAENSDAMYDGYSCLITSELDYSEKKLCKINNMLKMIEISRGNYSIMLENVKMVYARTDKHIRAYNMINHIATLLIRLIQISMGDNAISPERIRNVLQKCILDYPSAGIVHLHEISGRREFATFFEDGNIYSYSPSNPSDDKIAEDFKRISHAIHLDLKKAYMRQEEFVRAIRNINLSADNA